MFRSSPTWGFRLRPLLLPVQLVSVGINGTPDTIRAIYNPSRALKVGQDWTFYYPSKRDPANTTWWKGEITGIRAIGVDWIEFVITSSLFNRSWVLYASDGQFDNLDATTRVGNQIQRIYAHITCNTASCNQPWLPHHCPPTTKEEKVPSDSYRVLDAKLVSNSRTVNYPDTWAVTHISRCSISIGQRIAVFGVGDVTPAFRGHVDSIRGPEQDWIELSVQIHHQNDPRPSSPFIHLLVPASDVELGRPLQSAHSAHRSFLLAPLSASLERPQLSSGFYLTLA